MVVNLIYCIDIPQKSENLIETDRVVGWMLCSHNILHISIADNSKNYSLNYGLSRPDVGLHFKDFPDNDHGGFSVISSNDYPKR
jgi:formaldehyde-activating enzyme involved in methanogenesis